MKMQLISLTLENFKCYEHTEFRFDGRNASIFGANGTGKSSIYDAFTWLLFGKDSKGSAKSETLKPSFTSGENEGKVKDSGAITSVEAVLLVDGVERKLKRTYYELWSTKRGSAEKTRDGHSSDYFVDDVPCKKNEFARRVGEIIDEDRFKLLTNLFFFPEALPWQKRREVLFDVAAVATDEEILASDARFAPLASALRGLTLDDYRKKLAAQRKGLNKTREDTPARLDECKKTIGDLSGIDFDALERQRAEAQERRTAAQREVDQAERDGGRTDLQNQLAGIRNELGRLENENAAHRLAQQQAQGLDEAAQVRQSLNAVRIQGGRRQSDLEYLRGRQKSLEGEVAACRAKWNEINGEEFKGGVCPTCGQALPKDKLEAAVAGFEQDKARRKGEAVEAANRAKAALKGIQEDIAKLEQKLVEDLKQAEELAARLQQLESAPKTEITDMEDYAVRKAELEAQAAAIHAELDGLAKETVVRVQTCRSALADADRELDRLSGELSKKAALEYATKRMDELREQAAAASDELNKLDGILFLCEEFTRYKVKFIEESINRRFSMVRFRLFREQINGGLEDCCDVTVDGVPFGEGLNTGARFNAGIDIINTLSRHYGAQVPLFVDNAESVTPLAQADTQVIRLVVSEADKELRCELTDGGLH